MLSDRTMAKCFATDITDLSSNPSLRVPNCAGISISYSHKEQTYSDMATEAPLANSGESHDSHHENTCDKIASPHVLPSGYVGFVKEEDMVDVDTVSGERYFLGSSHAGSEENLRLLEDLSHSSSHPRECIPAINCLTDDWAQNLILECAKAIYDGNIYKVQYMMRILADLSSPYGDLNQRLAACFLQGFLSKLTGNGSACHNALIVAADRSCSFLSTRGMILKYQEVSPWMTFGHVAANGALMETFNGETKVHIIDISDTFCTQWPTFLEALATRSDGAPHLRLTSIMATKQSSEIKVMKEIENRLTKFARLMGVPFEFRMIQLPELDKLQIEMLELREGEALAINCIHSLHNVSEKSYGQLSHRDMLLYMFRSMKPKLLAIVEEEVDLVSFDFMSCICEALRFYFLKFDSLEDCFPRISSERLMLERIAARKLVNVVACEDSENLERQEKTLQWVARLKMVGFSPVNLSDDVVFDVTSLLKRYKEGWGFAISGSALILTWKDQHVISASFWKPC
ncbi:hypothetical protein O6H91_16G045000 [Diphasiastrum complanatum]|uniref:Uncharacterized protein n=1 Tax=Diphasiastrum complanatum TaxID=34168 RepID=A0ACC2BBZ5_DIPCM|nr:hypothetical protein O6H91_16G045000 [Diphasiastrum complanatum]